MGPPPELAEQDSARDRNVQALDDPRSRNLDELVREGLDRRRHPLSFAPQDDYDPPAERRAVDGVAVVARGRDDPEAELLEPLQIADRVGQGIDRHELRPPLRRRGPRRAREAEVPLGPRIARLRSARQSAGSSRGCAGSGRRRGRGTGPTAASLPATASCRRSTSGGTAGQDRDPFVVDRAGDPFEVVVFDDLESLPLLDAVVEQSREVPSPLLRNRRE